MSPAARAGGMRMGRFRFAPVLAGTVITVLLLLLFGQTADIFLLLFISVLLALYLDAGADFLTRRFGVPRRLALLITIVLSLAAMAGILWLLVPPVVEQTQGLLRVLPDYIAAWEVGVERFMERQPALRAIIRGGQQPVILAIYQQVSGYFQDVVPKIVSLFHVTISVFSVAVMAIYLSLNPGLYREWFIALFPPLHRDLVRNVLADLARTLRAWIVGQLIAMTFLGALTALGLYVLRVPYWLAFGVLTGLVSIVPFFGTLISTTLPALFVLGGSGGVTRALLVAGLGVVIHLIESNFVGPVIMHRQVELPPVLTIMAVLIMGKLLGPVGLVVAVPSVAVLMVVVRRILLRRLYEGLGFRRAVRDRVFIVRAPAPEGGIIVHPGRPPDVIALAEEERRQRVA